MIRLKPRHATTKRVALPNGAVLVMRPATMIDRLAAESNVAAAVRRLGEGQDTARAYGLDIAGPFDAFDEGQIKALGYIVMLVELGRLLISEWDGICDEAGEPLAIDRQSLGMLFQLPDIVAAFESEAFAALSGLDAEGNGFAPSSPGGQAGVRDFAPAAGMPVSPVPPGTGSTAGSAPSENTH
jgi:hypothetical protein